jgi:flagellar biosynthesis protein FlhF
MRLRTFHAQTTAAAMSQIRQELGPDAVIVSNQAGRRGVRITAAVEQPPAAPEIGEPRSAKRKTRSKTQSDSRSEITGWRPETATVIHYHRVPETLQFRLEKSLKSFDGTVLEDALADALETLYRFVPLPDGVNRPLVLVGPPGAGKTVTIAKLATRAVVEGRKVAAITTDTVRAGGVEQLEAFTRILNVPLTPVESPAGLTRAVTRIRAENPETAILIDTPGLNPFNRAELVDLRRFLDGIDAAPTLVLPAGGDSDEAMEIATACSAVGARQLIGTRIDAARRFGGLLAAADSGALSFSEISISPYVSDGLVRLDSQALAKLLMHGPSGALHYPVMEMIKS